MSTRMCSYHYITQCIVHMEHMYSVVTAWDSTDTLLHSLNIHYLYLEPRDIQQCTATTRVILLCIAMYASIPI